MSESRYFNRELSWLEFNQRVLDPATDRQLPLLERLRFLAITASNLDEFFMVRVGGLTLVADSSRRDPSGLTAAQQLEAISEVTQRMLEEQYECYVQDLEPSMADQQIRRLQADELNERQAGALQQIFASEIFPVASPMAVDQDQAFPLLANQVLHCCIRLKPAGDDPRERFAILPLGCTINRILSLPSDGGYVYLLVEDAVRLMIHQYFPNDEVRECIAFRLTRNADFAVDDDEASDLLREMQQVLTARQEGACVRLEIEEAASETMLGYLKESLGVGDREVYRATGPVDLAAMMPLCDLPGFESLRFKPWTPQPAPDLDVTDMFAAISQRDILLHHPYDSFEPMVRLLQQAADDPDVLAIKQTLYRTSRTSPVVDALRRAAKLGKYVTALVELKARFDEARNIEWAQSLEQAGAQVIYGVKGLKTHSKICVIVRREPHGIQRYVHYGTGNYNEKTAALYTDISYFTAREELGVDASRFFNAITGASQPQRFNLIDAAPLGMRERLVEMIEGETDRQRQGEKAQIIAKMNSLVDPEIIEALYGASQAGVPILLNIRGICCLRPGIEGLSDNIRVVSIVDRFLEHSRVFYFHHGGDERVFISSADWMPRNLDRRVELLVPIVDKACKRTVMHILEACFRDNVKARRLLPNGEYVRIDARGEPFQCQQQLADEAREAVRLAEQAERAQLSPHKPPDSDS